MFRQCTREIVVSTLWLCSLSAWASPAAPSPWFIEMAHVGDSPYAQRMGYYKEAPGVEFKGCVLYLQGLGDSMLNHQPFFKHLSQSGYRVLTFDYLGQGGSEGDMNDTRLSIKNLPWSWSHNFYEIGHQANFVWRRYRDCVGSRVRVVGWSAGGLAAYKLAREGWPDSVVLISPGLSPRLAVGEAAADGWRALSDQILTERTLTRNRFTSGPNPHVDPIKPDSPADVFSGFIVNLLSEAMLARFWEISPSIPGLVFVSHADPYIFGNEVAEIVRRNSPHFNLVEYENALHELDNELPSVAQDLYSRTVQFLDSQN